MDNAFLGLLEGASRLGLYVGFVMTAGSVLFWVLVRPPGPLSPYLRRSVQVGAGVLAASTVALPLLQWADGPGPLTQAVSREAGAAALVRLAVLVAGAALVGGARREVRRATASVCLLAVLVLTLTLVLQSDAVEGSHVLLKVVASTGHLLATAAWLGGLVALATVVIPREDVAEVGVLVPRFSRVAFVSVLVLVVTGALHGIAVAGGVSELVGSSYGVLLGFKAAAFVLMLVLAGIGRRYAQAAVLRQLTRDEARESSTVQSLALALGTELAVAGTVLALTAALVAAAPPSA